jgi:heat shock protein HslJ
LEELVFKKSIVLIVGLLLVSCASGATQTPAVTPASAETEPPVVAADPTEPAEVVPSPAEPPVVAAKPTEPLDDQPLAVLPGVVWYLQAYLEAGKDLSPVLAGSQVTAEFGFDGTLSGTGGCNRYSGGYELDGAQIQIGPLASTMMACLEPAGLMEQESAYLKALEGAASYRLEEGKLELLDPAGQVILVFSKTPPATDPAAGQPMEPPASLALEGLKNATYQVEFTNSGLAPLKDGVYSEPAAAGSAAQTTVTLTDSIAYGLLPDGQTAAAVILATSTGGSGTFYQLALVTDADGTPVNIANTFLGDRIIVHSLAFEEGKLAVELTRQGPDDPMCCPTQRMLEVYAYQDGELAKVSSVAVAAPSLTGVVWQWQEFQSSDETIVKPENPEVYTVEFLTDGKLSIQADCNRAMGTYTVDGSLLTLEVTGITKAACPPGSLSDQFLRYLSDVVSHVFQEGDLYLALKYDSGIMKFTAPGSQVRQSLTGGVWQWQEFQSSDETVVKPENPAVYTVEFMEDGTLAVGADCNRGMGTYKVDGSQLTLEVTAMTMAACPTGSLSDQFLRYLNDIVSYVFEEGNLYLALKYDSGIMKFTSP